MSNHPNWHDQQSHYSAPPPPRHHSNMDAYAGPSPSSLQPPPYSNPSNVPNYAQPHLPPPLARQPPQQQWSPSASASAAPPSHEFSGPSPTNSTTRSSGPYAPAFDAGPGSIGSTTSPMRQHGSHASSYTSQSPYGQHPSHASSEQHMHPATRGIPPQHQQYNHSPAYGPNGGYSHPHHPSSHSQSAPPPPHSSQPPHNHWNAGPGPIPSVLQPQSLQQSNSRSGSAPGTHLDRPFGGGILKAEDDDDEDPNAYDDYDSKGKARDPGAMAAKGTSDFVKKLFSMLDDKAYESVVAWSPSGESFIVKDMNDFTKHVLPRNFRHSNFASFVRQLNKYDFHKVKNPEDGSGQVGELAWEFQHSDFVRGREHLLENVKRKIPAKKKQPGLKGGVALGDADARDESPSMAMNVVDGADKGGESYADLKAQVANLTAVQDQMQNHILALTKQYQGVIGEMLTFQRNIVQQDQLMQNLIQYLMNLEQDRPTQVTASSFLSGGSNNNNDGNTFLSPGGVAHKLHMPLSYGDGSLQTAVAPHSVGSSKPSGETSTNAASTSRLSGMTSVASTAAPLSPKSVASPRDGHHNNANTPEVATGGGSQLAPMMLHPPHMGDESERRRFGGAVSGSMQQQQQHREDVAERSDADDYRKQDPSQQLSLPSLGMPKPPQIESRTSSSSSTTFSIKDQLAKRSAALNTPTGEPGNYLRVRRSTLVPGWAVPPRVLLVDDDEVCRRLSSKFLQVFGCSIDYAVDGMSAVAKMNAEKYDLVLMDIVMPNLDGISATSLIRQFDGKTPIISMTSNSGPSELINYMSSGMTDILPKPFTKEGLLNMLEKHLLHLKAVGREHRASGGDMGHVANVIKAVSPAPFGNNHGNNGNNGDNGDNHAGADGGGDLDTPSNTVNGDSNNSNAGGQTDGSLNPLAGMGFTDEEYVAMLQNLISAGTDDDYNIGLSMATAGQDGTGKDIPTSVNEKIAFLPQTPLFKRTASIDGHHPLPSHHHHHHHHHCETNSNKRPRFGEIS
ncbi:related to SKN7 - transcription factor [Melanopsichium pennsylvanicum]|uniref:Related to SKN7 - transcription factor n=2 Tax=Melanopsichium pennsylvanicum TaxID=63383 RepID=A0AAJ4XN46_9BASI